MLAIECQPSRIEMRLRTRYLDKSAATLDEALAMMERAARDKRPLSVGVLGNAAEMLPELVRRGVKRDAVTDPSRASEPVLMLTGGSLLVGAVGRTDLLGAENAPAFSAACQVASAYSGSSA